MNDGVTIETAIDQITITLPKARLDSYSFKIINKDGTKVVIQQSPFEDLIIYEGEKCEK